MCHQCSDKVSMLTVMQSMARWTLFMHSAQIAISATLGVAIRLLARMAQSAEYHSAINAGDENTARDILRATLTQAIEFASDYPKVDRAELDANHDGIMRAYHEIATALNDMNTDFSNSFCAALMAFSELIFVTPFEPPTNEQIERAITDNVFLFNAEKEFSSGNHNGLLN